MSEKPPTLSIVPYDKTQQEHTSSNPKPFSTEGIANCQLMFDRGGAFFEFPLPPKSSPVYIGRKTEQAENSTNIDLTRFNAYDSGVSRTHARFERAGTRLFLRDLNSTNGTRLNGKRLAPMEVHEIRHGDKIQFGGLSAQFYIKS
jgi:FHA domain